MELKPDPKKIEELLTRRVEAIYPDKESLKKLLLSGKRLRLYQGFDPSTPNLHIGHLVGLLKLKEFQDLGHEVIFLIGDFTGMIGDPTGKLKTRKVLSHKQVLQNAKNYQQQAQKILNFKGKNPVKIKFNSEWNQKLKAADFLKLAQLVTFQQLIERDMFQQRLKQGKNIYLNELIYPLIQGYDTVAMMVDLEIGGSDQMFNMMMGRQLMKKIKNKEKFVMTTKLLTDEKGHKIGKTEGNAINLNTPPLAFYGQIMNLPDEAIKPCFELITELPAGVSQQEKNPLLAKKRLAFTLTKMLNGETAAQKAQAEFEKVYQKRELPSQIKTLKLKIKKWQPADLLVYTKLCPSKTEAKRLIKQGAVKINQQTLKDLTMITLEPETIIKVGKKQWLKVNCPPS